jgi:hypothetical protein
MIVPLVPQARQVNGVPPPQLDPSHEFGKTGRFLNASDCPAKQNV